MPGFNDWSIQDHDGCLSIDNGRVSWLKADRTAVRYIRKQVDIPGDFIHSFVVCFQDGEVEDEQNQGFIRLWEVRNDWENRTWVYARKNGDGWTIYFEQLSRKDKVIAFQGSSKLRFGDRYTVKVSRVESDYRLEVQDDAGMIAENSQEVEGVLQSYEYIWLASTIKSRRNNGNWSTGYVENFTMASQEYP
ncbi:MAG: hypothetical protein ACEROO_09735 [Candidatus Bathyarchaeota archaeon]